MKDRTSVLDLEFLQKVLFRNVAITGLVPGMQGGVGAWSGARVVPTRFFI